jgi:transcriptional regulator with XRE-family HTH domain
MRELKDRISYLLDVKGYTAYQASQDTGISESTFSLIIKGKTKKLRKDTAVRLAQYFNVSTYWLITGNGEMIQPLDQNGGINPASPKPICTDPLHRDLEKKLIIAETQIDMLKEQLKIMQDQNLTMLLGKRGEPPEKYDEGGVERSGEGRKKAM